MPISAPFPFALPVDQAVTMQVVDSGRLPLLVQANAACDVRNRFAAVVTDHNKAASAVAGCHCLDRHRHFIRGSPLSFMRKKIPEQGRGQAVEDKVTFV